MVQNGLSGLLRTPAVVCGGGTQEQEIEAAIAFGRLDGRLESTRAAVQRLFAGMVLRKLIVSALRQEGHSFTDHRFQAWFAGLATLSDEPSRTGRPPRAVAETILTELSHSSWLQMAALASSLRPALLAPFDHADKHTGYDEAQKLVARARDVLERLPPRAKLQSLLQLSEIHLAVKGEIAFAPSEPTGLMVRIGSAKMIVDQPTPASPRWAIETVLGECWKSAGAVRCPLPWPDLLRVEALRLHPSESATRSIIARSLLDAATAYLNILDSAERMHKRMEAAAPGRRTTSRAKAAFELLAGFGTLRGSQLEIILGATRLGVRSILTTLGEAGLIGRSMIGGVNLYSADAGARCSANEHRQADEAFFSSEAVEDYDAAMAHIDALLARSGQSDSEPG